MTVHHVLAHPGNGVDSHQLLRAISSAITYFEFMGTGDKAQWYVDLLDMYVQKWHRIDTR
jgi:hypothetical protein